MPQVRENFPLKTSAPDLVIVYEAPAQIGFPAIASPLQIKAAFPELGAVCCRAVSPVSQKSSLARERSVHPLFVSAS